MSAYSRSILYEYEAYWVRYFIQNIQNLFCCSFNHIVDKYIVDVELLRGLLSLDNNYVRVNHTLPQALGLLTCSHSTMGIYVNWRGTDHPSTGRGNSHGIPWDAGGQSSLFSVYWGVQHVSTRAKHHSATVFPLKRAAF